MMSHDLQHLTIESTSTAETEKIGQQVGQHLNGGDVVALEGDLGMGKTSFIRGLARGLDIKDREVSSPTFVFVHEHHGRLSLIHMDLFRIEQSEDLFDLGIMDYLEGPRVIAIEWAEKAGSLLPENKLTIKINETRNPQHRQLAFKTANPGYQPLLTSLKECFCILKSSNIS